MYEEYQNIIFLFGKGPIKVAYCKKYILNFGMHAQLINMHLKESMIVKGI
jgi:hypothetical protein